MPISFTEVESTGDALPNNRHVLFFPSIAGVTEGKTFTLRHTTVTLPPMQVGQIIVKQLGWSVAFAGIRTQQNTFTVDFVETNDAPVIKSLARWQDICSGFKTHLAKLKSDYAVKAQCRALDTTGKQALIVDLYNVWPVNITYGQYTEESTASVVNVEFSVDAIDIVGVQAADNDYQRSISTSQAAPSLWYQSRSGGQFPTMFNDAPFRVAENVVKQLGLTQTNLTSIMNRFF